MTSRCKSCCCCCCFCCYCCLQGGCEDFSITNLSEVPLASGSHVAFYYPGYVRRRRGGGRHRRKDVSICTANTTGWDSFETLLATVRLLVFCGQEIRLTQSQLIKKHNIISKLGYRFNFSAWLSGREGGNSAGVVASHIGSGHMQPNSDEDYTIVPGRAVFAHINAWVQSGVVTISLYLITGREATGENWEVFEKAAHFVHDLSCPWAILGDWNMHPSVLFQSGFPELIGGKAHILSPNENSEIFSFLSLMQRGRTVRRTSETAPTHTKNKNESPGTHMGIRGHLGGVWVTSAKISGSHGRHGRTEATKYFKFDRHSGQELVRTSATNPRSWSLVPSATRLQYGVQKDTIYGVLGRCVWAVPPQTRESKFQAVQKQPRNRV